jgi:hypothetical protein
MMNNANFLSIEAGSPHAIPLDKDECVALAGRDVEQQAETETRAGQGGLIDRFRWIATLNTRIAQSDVVAQTREGAAARRRGR